jgi:hypothetical protein
MARRRGVLYRDYGFNKIVTLTRVQGQVVMELSSPLISKVISGIYTAFTCEHSSPGFLQL